MAAQHRPRFRIAHHPEGWCVEAKWPNKATVDRIAGPFDTEAEAFGWLAKSSEDWLERRLKG